MIRCMLSCDNGSRAVLKTVVSKGIGSSNLSLSVIRLSTSSLVILIRYVTKVSERQPCQIILSYNRYSLVQFIMY